MSSLFWLRLKASALLAILLLLPLSACAQGGRGKKPFEEQIRSGKRPRLAIVISIDQFRADLLTRNVDLFLPARNGKKVGGFRYLMHNGSWYVNAHHSHFPTFTGPGHSVLLTGSTPSFNGIIANEWFDRALNGVRYCVEDESVQVVGKVEGSRAKPMSARNLLVTTIGDELKMATNRQAKVVSLALKDRAAILMTGHNSDSCVWFDEYTGRWISSTAYAKKGELPAWAKEINARGIPDAHLGKEWNSSLSAEALKRALPPNIKPENDPYELGLKFPHRISPKKGRVGYRGFALTPYGNEFVFETAKAAVKSEKLGQRAGIPDLLTINLSTNDYAGHAFGPYSPEVLDVTVQTDRQLAEFLNFVEENVPGGLNETVVVITADHGVVPIVEQLRDLDVGAGRVTDSEIEKVIELSLVQAFGGQYWVGGTQQIPPKGAYVEPYITLNEDNIREALQTGKAKSREEIENVVAHAVSGIKGIYACYTRSQLLQGRVPQTPVVQQVTRGFHPRISGDIVVVSDPMFYTDPGTPGPYSTSHGTPYSYDTHVPILLSGFKIRAGVWSQRVSTIDIASTLSLLLGIEFPSGNEGNPLTSALHE
jgi:predicted AlkP superfamily pyrophosphatase or phosphodiesterase